MPFYAGSTRVNLNSASPNYQPADSSGAACTLSNGRIYIGGSTATNFYATGSWHTIWTGNQYLNVAMTTEIGENWGITTISGLSGQQSGYIYKITVSTDTVSGQVITSSQQFTDRITVSGRVNEVIYTVFTAEYASNTSVTIDVRTDSVTRVPMATARVTKIEAYY